MKSLRSHSLWLVLLGFGLIHCRYQAAPAGGDYLTLEGPTMGTYYRVTYRSADASDYQGEIDELLRLINLEVSTYIDSSTISRFNQSADGLDLSYNPYGAGMPGDSNRHFLVNYRAARQVFQTSKGHFDPTVMPLVNYWGFGYAEKRMVNAVDTVLIDSLMRFVGMDKVRLDSSDRRWFLAKASPGVQLDFSACAKGYAVDEVARLLESKDVKDYLVDIGGEVRARGRNEQGRIWTVGINIPMETAALTDIQSAIPLQDGSVATSGNYRNFYEVDGVKYSHTINPRTGFPERNTLLSASVFTNECMIADAYATTFMVMGVDSALLLAESLPGLEAYFIFGKPDGSMGVSFTSGLRGKIEQRN